MICITKDVLYLFHNWKATMNKNRNPTRIVKETSLGRVVEDSYQTVYKCENCGREKIKKDDVVKHWIVSENKRV